MDREDIIENNEKWFKFFVYLPLISAGIVGLTFVVLGFVSCVNDGFGTLLAYWGIGVILSVITYVVTKLSLSYKVLHIYYLQELRETNQDVLKKMACLEKQSEEEI